MRTGVQMGENRKYYNPDGVYFVSFSVIEWLEVFKNDTYKEILLKSLSYCQKNKGMEIYAWCIMTHHVHLIFRSTGSQLPSMLLADFKRFTSRAVVKVIQENSNCDQSEHFLSRFRKAAMNTKNVKHHQFWQHSNYPVEIWSDSVLEQKINYIHYNPVKAGFVEKPEDYRYSSAADYAGGKGPLEIVFYL